MARSPVGNLGTSWSAPSFAVAHSILGDAANAFHQYWNIAEKLAQQVTSIETIPISIPASIPQINLGIDSVQIFWTHTAGHLTKDVLCSMFGVPYHILALSALVSSLRPLNQYYNNIVSGHLHSWT